MTDQIFGLDEKEQPITIKVTSTDNVSFTLTMDEINLSRMLMNACSGNFETNYDISVIMTAPYLKLAVEYLRYHAIHPPKNIPEPPPHNDFAKLVDPFDYELVKDIPSTQLLQYHHVLSYLMIDSLESLLLQRAASLTINCSPEQYCEILGIDVESLRCECNEDGHATWYDYVLENIKYELKG